MLRQAYEGVVRVQGPEPGQERATVVNVAQLGVSKRVAGVLLAENADRRGPRAGVLGEHEVEALRVMMGALPV